MKKKRLDFANRHASWDIFVDIEIDTFPIYQNTLFWYLMIALYTTTLLISCSSQFNLQKTLNCLKLQFEPVHAERLPFAHFFNQ